MADVSVQWGLSRFTICSRSSRKNVSGQCRASYIDYEMHSNGDTASWALPASTFFAIRDTPSAGRAVFCNQPIFEQPLLLTTSTALSPISHVILRPYSKEVCSWCFAYDRGREWRIRDTPLNKAFCSEECQRTWDDSHDSICRNAISTVEAFTKQQSRRQHQEGNTISTLTSNVNPDSKQELDIFWSVIDARGKEILDARKCAKLTKPQRATLRKAAELRPDTDILSYVVSGLITAHNACRDSLMSATERAIPEKLLPSLFKLMPDDNVFINNPMTVSPLEDYATSYLVLLSLLPLEMIDIISTKFVINLAARAAHNAFSIRPEGLTDGEQSGEFLGWGVWPEASFFNHSCQPNVRKERHGRRWSFFVDVGPGTSIAENQQLCITYLGGDEKDLDVHERRKRLQEQWGFRCQCERCTQEGGGV